MNVKLYNDDCLNVLKDIGDNSIDLVVTDPPYEVITGGRNGGVKGKPSGILTENKQLVESIWQVTGIILVSIIRINNERSEW